MAKDTTTSAAPPTTVTNDERILAFREKIAAKKRELGTPGRLAPVTNCSLTLYGQSYNLNVADVDTLKLLAATLHSLVTGIRETGYDTFKLAGYDVQDWIADVQARLDLFEYKAEQAKLASWEKQLAALLSKERETALLLDDIGSFLS